MIEANYPARSAIDVLYRDPKNGWSISKYPRWENYSILHLCDNHGWSICNTAIEGPHCCQCGDSTPSGIISLYRVMFMKNPDVIGVPLHAAEQ